MLSDKVSSIIGRANKILRIGRMKVMNRQEKGREGSSFNLEN
jgi:hypothetical protein